MLKGKVLENIQGVLDEWLVGFNAKDDFQINVLSSEKFNLKNAIINAERVNQELEKAKAPIRLKVGIIGKISVKVSITNLTISRSNSSVSSPIQSESSSATSTSSSGPAPATCPTRLTSTKTPPEPTTTLKTRSITLR
jgi:predicted nuclease with TOPRIM domain